MNYSSLDLRKTQLRFEEVEERRLGSETLENNPGGTRSVGGRRRFDVHNSCLRDLDIHNNEIIEELKKKHN